MANTATQQDIEQIWTELEIGIEDVYAHRAMTTKRFMELYSYVYNYCTNTVIETGGSGRPNGARVRTGGGNSRARRRNPVANDTNSRFSTGFVGHDLYNRIKDFLRKYLENLAKDGAEIMGEDLLTFYQTQWEHFTFSSKVMNGFCAYLNRHWVRREHEEGKEHIYQIYQLCLDMWKDVLFETLQERSTNTLLSIIERHRNGEGVNERLIREIVSSYVELGMDQSLGGVPGGLNAGPTPASSTSSTSASGSKLGIYRSKFEAPFLAATETFYTKEAAAYVANSSVPEYLKRAEQRLLEEEKRVSLYLHESTLSPLKNTCENIMVQGQLEAIHAEFPNLLKDDKQSDLGRLYGLVSRLNDAFGTMKEILEEHIAVDGANSIKQNGEACLNDPKTFVKTIVEVHTKYINLCKGSFNSDPGFIASLDRACGRFINNNYVTEVARSSQKSPEILARHCDILLKKSGKNLNDDELEDGLNEVMVVFKYLNDKDVFQKYYSKTLANRLVLQMSASDDAESSMIGKLKQACGFEYTSKLQRMYQDIGLCRDMNEDFKQWLLIKQAIPSNIDLNVLVLSTGFWPFTQMTDFSLPRELEPCVNQFSEYYGEKHTGRKLSWVYNRSTVEVVTNGYNSRYTFIAWTFQAAVMLLFNQKDSYTMGELIEATKLKEDIMIQILQIFLRMKLFVSPSEEGKLTPESEIKIFKEYKNKKLRVAINVPLKYETKVEDDKTRASVDDERKYVLQAAIVRVMKDRKKLDHQNLVAEVIKIVQNKFKATVPLIKKQVDALLEKEYLARDPELKDTYNYVA